MKHEAVNVVRTHGEVLGAGVEMLLPNDSTANKPFQPSRIHMVGGEKTIDQ